MRRTVTLVLALLLALAAPACAAGAPAAAAAGGGSDAFPAAAEQTALSDAPAFVWCAADNAGTCAAQTVGRARETRIARVTDDVLFAPKTEVYRAQVACLLHNYLSQTDTADIQEITLTVAGQAVSVSWADNSTVDALRELLNRNGPITLDMSDYAGFEKGAPLPEALPQNNEPMSTDAGDVILYQGRQFVIYYDKNNWSLTPLGKITGIDKAELQALLGTGNVTAELSLPRSDAAETNGQADR